MQQVLERVCFILMVFYLFFLSSCSISKSNIHVSQLNYCDPPNAYQYDSAYLPLDDISCFTNNDSLFLKRFSKQDLLLANASGTFMDLRKLVHLQEKPTTDEDTSVDILITKQKIFDRLMLASTELASIAAELDCEAERSKQLATYLDQMNDSRIQKLTILSVVTGATTSIITTISKNNRTQLAVGISGSLISGISGGLAAFSSQRKILFMHTRNLLADIWLEPVHSKDYPPFIWYFLTKKEFNSTTSLSIMRSLKNRWIEQGLIGLTREGTIKSKEMIFFGTGGNYCADDLHTRTSMLNQLKAEIRSINQNLQSLMLKLTV